MSNLTETRERIQALAAKLERIEKKGDGNYHLDYAYSGVKLVMMCNIHGGISTISTDGFGTKRELYNWMTAFLAGIATK